MWNIFIDENAAKAIQSDDMFIHLPDCMIGKLTKIGVIDYLDKH
jgi:hypothetical protein